jgi:putative PIN family toxin of toxin-antitoxin system
VRLVIDTNVLISALLVDTSLPAHLLTLWREGRFDLLTSMEQLDELMRVTRYPKIRARLSPPLAGRLINELRDIAVVISNLPAVTICSDPDDNHLLALAAAGSADFLVTGDKRDLLGLKHYERASIVTVREFLTLSRRLPPP